MKNKVIEKKYENIEKHSFIFDKIENNLNNFIPKSFNDYIGQEKLKEKLKVHILSAKKRNVCLDHILFFGPPGLGKTTISILIANEIDAKIKIINGPAIQKTGDLVAILSQLKKNDILFIDEIHRLPIIVEEILYTAMEQFSVDIIIGQGMASKTMKLSLQPFTLIGATTKAASISSPLRSRFGITEKIDFYGIDDLSKIIKQSLSFYSINLNEKALNIIANCSRGTPRIAKKLIKKIIDYFVINEKKNINEEDIKEALNFFGIIENGLTQVDIIILKILYERGVENPIGIKSLSSLIGEEESTIEDVYEPLLFKNSYIERTPRGRIIGIKKISEIKNLF